MSEQVRSCREGVSIQSAVGNLKEIVLADCQTVAFDSTIAQIVAAVLPCQLGYTEIAAELAMTVAK
jgi:hypothetical protein